eukprot:6090637-Amphidinium_carterae.1
MVGFLIGGVPCHKQAKGIWKPSTSLSGRFTWLPQFIPFKVPATRTNIFLLPSEATAPNSSVHTIPGSTPGPAPHQNCSRKH